MTPDDSALLHMRPDYDPAKAREYYLKTRHLKGRRAGVKQRPLGAQAVAVQPRPITRRPPAIPPKAFKKSSKALRAEARARAEALEVRLTRLRKVLAELVDAAKERSGTKDKDEKTPAEKQRDAKGKDPQTAKEKREAKKRYEKEKAQNPTAKVKELQGKLKKVQDEIAAARLELKRATAKNAAKRALKGDGADFQRIYNKSKGGDKK